jgi:hypothetical protein
MSYEFTKQVDIELELKCSTCNKNLIVAKSMSDDECISIDYCQCLEERKEIEIKENGDKICNKIIEIIEKSDANEKTKLDILNQIDIGRLTDWD